MSMGFRVRRFFNILTNGRTWSLLKVRPCWEDGNLTRIRFSYTKPFTVVWSTTMTSADKRRILTLLYAMWKQALENSTDLIAFERNEDMALRSEIRK